MKKAIFGLVAAATLASIVAIPSVASAKKYYHHYHYHHVYVATSPSYAGLVRGQKLSYDECSQRAIKLGLGFGQSGNGDYMRECTTGRPSGGTRQRNGGS
jgi:hypothetical protein